MVAKATSKMMNTELTYQISAENEGTATESFSHEKTLKKPYGGGGGLGGGRGWHPPKPPLYDRGLKTQKETKLPSFS